MASKNVEYFNWDQQQESDDFWDIIERLDSQRKVKLLQGDAYRDPKAIKERVYLKILMARDYGKRLLEASHAEHD